MTIKSLAPHIAFDGTASKAIALYERALGAKTESLMRFGDAAQMGHPTPPEYRDRIIHAELRVGPGVLMVMDAPPGVSVATESNVQVSLDLDDLDDLARKFEALAAGGKVTLALHDAFWGSRFGMLVDAFGVKWMLGCELPK
jgi:PhnB protein